MYTLINFMHWASSSQTLFSVTLAWAPVSGQQRRVLVLAAGTAAGASAICQGPAVVRINILDITM